MGIKIETCLITIETKQTGKPFHRLKVNRIEFIHRLLSHVVRTNLNASPET